MGTSAVSIMLTVVVIQLHLRGDTPIPRWLRFLIFECLARVMLMSKSAKSKIRDSKMTEVKLENLLKTTKMAENAQFDSNNITRTVADHCTYNSSLPGQGHRNITEGNSVEFYLDAILKSILDYFEFKRIAANKDNSHEQWNEAAKVLDRFFMVLYIFTNIFAASVFFSIEHP
jgi:hypothetical protein